MVPPSTVVQPPATPAAAAAAPEASTRTVQNILFILGGLLLGTAAIVFTAVAWTTFGIRGRAAILGVVTLLALAAPVLALVRRLRATAETFAAIALLLVLLDGYAAWSVDLFHVQSLPGARYAGLVGAAVALVGLAYGRLTRLVGPGFVALWAAQPVLTLLLAPEPLSPSGWSLVWSATAAVNLAVAWLTRRAPSTGTRILRVLALVLYGVWLALAAMTALLAELVTDTVVERAQAGAATVAAGALFAFALLATRSRLLARCVGAAAVVSVAIAVGGVALAAWPNHGLLVASLVSLVAALVVAGSQPVLPSLLRPGPAVGAGLVAGGVGAVVGAGGLIAAIRTLQHIESTMDCRARGDRSTPAAADVAATGGNRRGYGGVDGRRAEGPAGHDDRQWARTGTRGSPELVRVGLVGAGRAQPRRRGRSGDRHAGRSDASDHGAQRCGRAGVRAQCGCDEPRPARPLGRRARGGRGDRSRGRCRLHHRR